jgi:acetaldehyde dehydrogenase/alcohol dehydrogenase
MVKAAYSSGKPAIGVGPGNTPALIDETADIKMAVNSVILSKTFDHGVICASEQSLIVHKDVLGAVKDELKSRGAYLVKKAELPKLREIILQKDKMVINPKIVGQSAVTIAGMAGLKVPPKTKVLVGEVPDVDVLDPMAHEKLSPILTLYPCPDFAAGVDMARQLIELGGFGHTSVIYTDPQNDDRIDLFAQVAKTGRILVNMPSSQGAIGDIYNFRLEPSLTLGCGSWGGNSVSENVGVKHLLNIKTLAERRENMLWFRIPDRIFHKYGCLPVALRELEGKKRAFIVTDGFLSEHGYADRVTDVLEELGIESRVFSAVKPDPTLASVYEGAKQIQAFQPDTIIALGGGSPMDAAKIMWLLYEHPETDFQDLAMRFMDIMKRIYRFPKMGVKADFVAIPTTSGTGSEVTPFAVITDEKTGAKYPIADYELTPSIAILDAELVKNMPASLTAASGIDAVTHSLEAMASVMSSDYTNGIALESLRILFKYLPESYRDGAKNIKAKEKVHNAATMAGMAFSNAFLGICHSMAHKLGGAFHLPHGVANAILIPYVIRYNAVDLPTKQAAFPQYEYPQAKARYSRVAAYLGLQGNTDDQRLESLIAALDDLRVALDLPKTIQDYGVNEKDFLAKVDDLALEAFDDQCTGSNPRYPLIAEIKALYINAFYGKVTEV